MGITIKNHYIELPLIAILQICHNLISFTKDDSNENINQYIVRISDTGAIEIGFESDKNWHIT